MIRKKRTFRTSDTEYSLVLAAVMSEINKHIPSNGLEAMIRSIVKEELKSVSPRGESG